MDQGFNIKKNDSNFIFIQNIYRIIYTCFLFVKLNVNYTFLSKSLNTMTERAEISEKPKSEITINIKSPIFYLTNSTLNSLYLYFKEDPEEQDNKELIKNRKKLLTCILKYGKVSELVSQKKRKTRKIIWNVTIECISLEIQNYGDIYRLWRKTRLDLRNIKFKTIENLSKMIN